MTGDSDIPPLDDGTVKLVWQEPPAGPRRPGGGPPVYAPALAEVKARAGAWARLRVLELQAAHSLRKRLVKANPDPAWEFRVCKLGDDKKGPYGLFVRYRTPAQRRNR